MDVGAYLEFEAALHECCRTHTGVNPCFDPAYLDARRTYQLLMVKHGMMRPEDLDEYRGR